MALSTTILGHAVERREDPALLEGRAEFMADLDATGVLEAVFVRSSVAHGLIVSIDSTQALEQPGVVAVLTASDLNLVDLPEWLRANGDPRPLLARPCLARDRVRFVGEAVAVVVAESASEAVDAAEHVVVEIDALPVVTDPLAALEEDAPLLFPEHGSNIVLSVGPTDDGDVLEGADVVVRARFYNQRVAPVPLEANGAFVRPGPGGHLDCFMSSQAPFQVRAAIARALGRPDADIRVRTPAVGGGFGAKGGVYPEQVVVAVLADRLGRPVRWLETRSENLLAMNHGRGQVQDVALGARRDGTLVGLQARTVTETGAYCSRGVIPLSTSRIMATGVYRIPRSAITCLGVVTNTTPIGPYRGAGRPEATAMLERAMELLSVELGIDSVELRRRNLLSPKEFPYVAPSGASYDSGNYAGALDRALELARYDELRADQKARRAAGTVSQIGIGISTFVEISGGGWEYGGVRVDRDGSVVVVTGSSPHGQGHETTLAQIAAGVLGVPMETVKVVHSDTELVPRGVGTFGSRSGQLGGSAIFNAAEVVRRRVAELAADLLEAAVEDIVVHDDGSFGVAGVPARALSLAELSQAAESRAATAPGEQSLHLAAETDFAQDDGTYPFGAHIAVVEIDTETGKVELRRMIAVDDCGRVLNPTIVEGQVHGGLAQGIGQALYEEVRYDENANPLTSTLADYLLPSAAELPSFELGETVTPSPRNPLGMKGIGESGAVGGAVAVQNAVLDALSHYGIRHLDMPLSPERVWQAIREAELAPESSPTAG
ncbi:MAG: xanthine dehydrogenase family protein molybdopterin-binding subunit [Acidimicrobiales bacterium]